MYKKLTLLLTLISLPFMLLSQDIDGFLMQYFIEDGDTLYIQELPPAIKRSWLNKKDKKNWRKFYKTVYNFSKTYPYALVAKEKVESANKYISENNLKGIKKEKYLRNLQNDLFSTFEKPLRKLTFTQGRMLMRMIDREVGNVSYSIIKDYRGGLVAGFWQGVAKMFGADLKKPYDPNGEDRNIEQLIQIYQKGDFNYIYFSIFQQFPPEPTVRAANDFPQKLNDTAKSDHQSRDNP